MFWTWDGLVWSFNPGLPPRVRAWPVRAARPRADQPADREPGRRHRPHHRQRRVHRARRRGEGSVVVHRAGVHRRPVVAWSRPATVTFRLLTFARRRWSASRPRRRTTEPGGRWRDDLTPLGAAAPVRRAGAAGCRTPGGAPIRTLNFVDQLFLGRRGQQ